MIADIRAAGLVSLRAIAAELNACGMMTRRGGTWGVGNVKGMLERVGGGSVAENGTALARLGLRSRH